MFGNSEKKEGKLRKRVSDTLGSLDANLEALGAFIGQVVSSFPACLGGEEAGNLRAEMSLEATVEARAGEGSE